MLPCGQACAVWSPAAGPHGGGSQLNMPYVHTNPEGSV